MQIETKAVQRVANQAVQRVGMGEPSGDQPSPASSMPHRTYALAREVRDDARRAFLASFEREDVEELHMKVVKLLRDPSTPDLLPASLADGVCT